MEKNFRRFLKQFREGIISNDLDRDKCLDELNKDCLLFEPTEDKALAELNRIEAKRLKIRNI